MSLQRACPFLGVLDSNSIRVEWEGQPRPVRLLDVDPEIGSFGGPRSATEFGRRTLHWARESYFKDVKDVVLEFPANDIMLSNSGRLLGYVFVNGDNYNVRLVREGWSPCFPKYGHPPIHREEMERAEQWARLEGRGIWGGLGGRGDYASLKSYWLLRAGQVACYRLATAMGEDILSCRFDYVDIVALARTKTRAQIFGDLTRSFHQSDGAILIQIGSPRQPLSALFPPTARALGAFVEREFVGPGKPNYIYVDGTLSLVGDSPQIVIEQLDQIATCPPNSLR